MIVEIKLIGDVALEKRFIEKIGYMFDVNLGPMDIPTIPFGSIIKKMGLFPETVQIGVAYPEGYFGILGLASGEIQNLPGIHEQFLQYYTNTQVNLNDGSVIRSFKKGHIYYAQINFPNELRDLVKSELKKINHIGVSLDGITGEVEICLKEDAFYLAKKYELNDLCCYHSLDYTVMAISPICISAPYSSGIKALDYIPGILMKKMLEPYLKPENEEELTCTNAYISDGTKRLLPTPICTAVVKLDKEQLRYRLAPGKNPEIVEQDVGIGHTFTWDPTTHLVKHTSPEFVRVTTSDGRSQDTIDHGQCFSGRIFGTDTMIRKIADLISSNPFLFIGDYTDESLGEIYIRIDEIKEKELPSPVYARTFDLECLSDTLLLNGEGMPTCKAEDLLSEIEYVLGVSNKLEIVGKYTDISNDFSKNYKWGGFREVTRCIARGSVLRIKTTDDSAIDISPIQYGFIGERTREGYGEIKVFPAKGTYYRVAEKLSPVRYNVPIPLTYRTTQLGASLISTALMGLLKQRVTALAHADQSEYKAGVCVEQLIPYELLRGMIAMYNPTLDEKTVVEWYRQGLEEKNV